MRDITVENITRAVVASMAADTDPRLRELISGLVSHLHDFIRETKPSHAEWRRAIDFLTEAGKISDDERNEFVLTSDVLGISSLVDAVNSAPGATESSVLGPFHILGAPDLPVGGDLKRDNPGDPVLVSGVVQDIQGNPIKGAVLEIWQTAANGLYSNQDPDQPEFNLRARMTTGPDGRYAFTTVKPLPYTVPEDGPVGTLLHALGRTTWRPSHLHVIIMAKGFRSVVTELFPDDDVYLDRDTVFGVRQSLVIRYEPRSGTSAVPADIVARDSLPERFFEVRYDFKLAKD